jgi:hypothetical protein
MVKVSLFGRSSRSLLGIALGSLKKSCVYGVGCRITEISIWLTNCWGDATKEGRQQSSG